MVVRPEYFVIITFFLLLSFLWLQIYQCDFEFLALYFASYSRKSRLDFNRLSHEIDTSNDDTITLQVGKLGLRISSAD